MSTLAQSWSEEFGRRQAVLERARKIHCPVCGAVFVDEEYTCVSSWGEDLHSVTCGSCDRDFLVKENVERTYETAVSERGFE